jgi:HD-GYP domain-containing protein (c-di-GMP phosphodiesterase class II)
VALYPLLSGIAAATDLISPILADHHKKVSFAVATIGQTLGLPMAEVKLLAMAGAVHDIGGLSIKRRLESFEYEVVEPDLHTVPGYVLLSTFPPFTEMARLVRFHHVAVTMAAKCGFDQDYRDRMLLAGLLHDIGKLVVPAEILAKHTPLTSGDFAVIRKHPYYSAWILRDIEGFAEISQWAALHHERMDGSGYPFRAPAAELPDGARILAVADTFTALTEERPYRCAMTRDGTDQVLRNMAAYQKIDPAYVALIHDHLEEFDHRRQTAQTEADTEHQRFLAACNLQGLDHDADEFCQTKGRQG